MLSYPSKVQADHRPKDWARFAFQPQYISHYAVASCFAAMNLDFCAVKAEPRGF